MVENREDLNKLSGTIIAAEHIPQKLGSCNIWEMCVRRYVEGGTYRTSQFLQESLIFPFFVPTEQYPRDDYRFSSYAFKDPEDLWMLLEKPVIKNCRLTWSSGMIKDGPAGI